MRLFSPRAQSMSLCEFPCRHTPRARLFLCRHTPRARVFLCQHTPRARVFLCRHTLVHVCFCVGIGMFLCGYTTRLRVLLCRHTFVFVSAYTSCTRVSVSAYTSCTRVWFKQKFIRDEIKIQKNHYVLINKLWLIGDELI